MTIASFNARLKKLNPHLRMRTRTGWVLIKSEGFSMVGLYRGHRYLTITTISGDMPYHTRPTLWRIESVPGIKRKLKYIHSRMRRGRYEFVGKMMGQKIIRHRWERQLMIM